MFDAPRTVCSPGRRTTLLALTVLILALSVWLLLMASALPTTARMQLTVVARNLSSGLFLIAGVLRMAAWRLNRDAATARSAIVLLVIGTALPSTSVLGLVLADGPVVRLEAPEVRLVFVLPILVVAVLGARHNRQLMRLTTASLATVTLLVAGVVTPGVGPLPADQRHTVLWLATEALMSGVWAALATQAWRRRRCAGGTTPGWVSTSLLLMCLGEALRAWSLADARAVHGVAGGFQLAAACVAAVAASAALRTSVTTETGHSGELTRALADTQHRLACMEQSERARLHDARSAVLGVIGASELLSRPATPALDPARLRSMVTNELRRLEGLLDTEHAEQLVEFELADALGGVVFARRLDGTSIDTDWDGARVLGRPRATATVLDNLLRNAHKHAPQAQVRIAARSVGAVVEIVVHDDGPGIPPSEYDSVLLAGVRGSTAGGTGSGLGLHVAATLMAAQCGSLEIDRCVARGAQIVLRLPSAVVADAISLPAMAS